MKFHLKTDDTLKHVGMSHFKNFWDVGFVLNNLNMIY